MRKILHDMGFNITELSEIMDVSRPTMYKFLDLYENGDRDRIDQNVLKFFDGIKRNPKMKKKDALYYALLLQGGRGRSETHNDRINSIVTVTIVERPVRKLVLLRAENATDYMSYCEEMGCEWENIMNRIVQRFDDAAIVTLPRKMILPGTSGVAAGVEVCSNSFADLPKGYEVVDLLSSTYLHFRGAPYDNEEYFCEAIGIVSEALDSYDPEIYGWEFDPESAPSFNYGASSKKGARRAVPIRKNSEMSERVDIVHPNTVSLCDETSLMCPCPFPNRDKVAGKVIRRKTVFGDD